MTKAQLLLTGFEPFGGWPRNPSADLATALGLDTGLRRLGLRTAVLPVDRTMAPLALRALLDRHRPRKLIMTGLAAGRRKVGIERIAANRWLPPGDGRKAERIEERAPAKLRATLPVGKARRLLQEAGVPASYSDSAGTYCCNLLLYNALRWAEADPEGSPSSVGFIHVPATTDTLPEGVEAPALDPGVLREAFRALCKGFLRI